MNQNHRLPIPFVFLCSLLLLAMLATLLSIGAAAQDGGPSAARETTANPALLTEHDLKLVQEGPAAPPAAFNPAAVLYDNGSLVTHSGGGAGGANASALQTNLDLGVYGFGHAISAGVRVADNFTVSAGGWNISTITFYAYQTGSSTTTTIDNVNLRIWNGPPGQAGSSIVFGDTSTNRLAGSSFSNIYRVLDTGLTDNQRPIMANVVTVNTALPAGAYWLDWQTGGVLSSGPWAPPVSILGQTGKPGANALQYDPATSEWFPVLDGYSDSYPQDFPFIIEGSSALTPNIHVNPLSLSSTQPTNTTVQRTLTIANTGSGTLNWQIAEEPATFTAGTPSDHAAAPIAAAQTLAAAGPYAHSMQAAAPVQRSPTALINDGNFENGPPPASAWTETSSTSCGWIGDWSSNWGVAAYDGVYDFWAGGYCDYSVNTNSAEQVIPVPATHTTLSFWYLSYRPDSDDAAPDHAYVQVNGNTVWTRNLTQANDTYPNWVNATVNLGAYAGQNVTLKLGAVSTGDATGNIRFDYVEFLAPQVCSNLADVPWLSKAPASGSTAGGASIAITVGFNSTNLAPGAYHANLCVTSNDPDPGPGNGTNLVVVPVTLTVSQSTPMPRVYLPIILRGQTASRGAVTGQVVNAVNAQAIAGAQVCVVSSNQCMTTNAQGNYTIANVAAGNQTVRASATGYVTLQQSVTVPAGGTATLNFALSPALAQGEMRIVLTWGATPRDLDSHLWLPPTNPFRIYYDNKGNCTVFPYACLDVDDISSYGPETVTIKQRFNGTYVYGVHNYSAEAAITSSGGRVQVYGQSGLVAQFNVPTSGSGRWWYVFDLNGGTGQITPRNVIQSGQPGSYGESDQAVAK